MTVDKDLFRLDYDKNNLIANENEIKLISDALLLPKNETKIFLEKFYGYFTSPPTVEFILYGINQNRGRKLKPIELARSMAKELRENPMNLILPKIILSQGEIRQLEKESPVTDCSGKDSKRKKSTIHVAPLESNKLKSKNRWNSDDPRDYIENFEKCPHGKPLIYKCGICNPKEYKSYWGYD